MRKRLVALGVASSLVGSGVVMGLMIPASSQQGATRITACARNRSGYTKDVDTGRSGFSAGDYTLEADTLRNPQSGKVIGRSVTKLTFVRIRKGEDVLFIVDDTASFAKGKISIYGYGKFGDLRKGRKFAIVGGTGSYSQARGALFAKLGSCGGKPGIRLTYNLRA